MNVCNQNVKKDLVFVLFGEKKIQFVVFKVDSCKLVLAAGWISLGIPVYGCLSKMDSNF